MRNLTLASFVLFTTGCPVAIEPTPLLLTSEHYAWTCDDYEDYTEVHVATETCDEDVRFIVAELHLTNGNIWKTNLKKENSFDCEWSEQFLLTEEFCVEVEGVALTAYVD